MPTVEETTTMNECAKWNFKLAPTVPSRTNCICDQYAVKKYEDL